jgi:hypothetical protein
MEDSNLNTKPSVEEQEMTTSRLTIILHPNPSRVDIVLNDRLFNTEKYSFSRKNEAVGREKELLDYCETCIVGVDRATANKNTLKLEISDGVLLKEFLPQVIVAIKRWGSSVERYEPEIFVDNRRWEESPVYNSDGWIIRKGIQQSPGQINIGFPYKIWTDGE